MRALPLLFLVACAASPVPPLAVTPAVPVIDAPADTIVLRIPRKCVDHTLVGVPVQIAVNEVPFPTPVPALVLDCDGRLRRFRDSVTAQPRLRTGKRIDAEGNE